MEGIAPGCEIHIPVKIVIGGNEINTVEAELSLVLPDIHSEAGAGMYIIVVHREIIVGGYCEPALDKVTDIRHGTNHTVCLQIAV